MGKTGPEPLLWERKHFVKNVVGKMEGKVEKMGWIVVKIVGKDLKLGGVVKKGCK